MSKFDAQFAGRLDGQTVFRLQFRRIAESGDQVRIGMLVRQPGPI